MRLKLLLSPFFLFIFMNSCIKDEPLYREADITEVKIEGDIFVSSTISEANQQIQIYVTDDADINSLAPVLTLSPGATVEPASGTVLDFSESHIYTVTSEDGNYSKQYTVSVTSEVALKYDFEEWDEGRIAGRNYPILTSDNNAWSSGNSGVATVTAANPFPTEKTTDSYYGTYGAKLQTIKGKNIPLITNIPIFAGSLFLGDFEANLASPLLSLKLGRIYPESNGRPTIFTGYYKYTPGSVFTDKDGNPVDGKIDECSIYAIIFKVSKGDAGLKEYLNGATVSTSDKVIARAEWSPSTVSTTDTPADKGFTKFTIPFKYSEDFDYSQYNYKLSIVMSSSKDGNLYEGAIGSTLIVDELEIKTESF